MALKLLINKTDGTEQDVTAYAPVFEGNTPNIKMGMRWADGEASAGNAVLLDETGNNFNGVFNLPGHGMVTLTEDASGCAIWVHRGRRSSIDLGRGIRKGGAENEWQLTTDDANMEIKNPHFTESWVRPEETDYARLVALQGYMLNGSSSTAPHHRDSCLITVNTEHRTPNTNTVTMPAKTYEVGATAQDVIQDCAEMAGKSYGVTIHHGGAGPGGLGDAGNDHTNHSSWPGDGQTADGLTVSLSQNVAAGKTIIAIVSSNGTGTYVGMSDTQGNTWTLLKYQLGTAAGGDIALYRCDVTNPLTTADAASVLWVNSSVDGRCIRLYVFDSVGTTVTTFSNAGTFNSDPLLAIPSASAGQLVVCGLNWARCGPYTPGVTDEITSGDARYTAIPSVIHKAGDAFGATEIFGGWRNDLSGTDTWVPNTPYTRNWVTAGVIFSSGDGPAPGGGGSGIGSDVGNCSHLCLQYIVPTETITNVSTVKISDVPSEWDPDSLTAPVLEPIPDQGMGGSINTQEQISALVSLYGSSSTSSTFVEDTAATAQDDFWTDRFDDSESVNSTQAAARAAAIVASRKFGHPTQSLSILMRADQLQLLNGGAGTLIQIKWGAVIGGTYLGTYVNRRVAECIFEPASPEVGIRRFGTPTTLYWAHLSLDRPPKRVPVRHGKGQSAATAIKDATDMTYDGAGGGVPGSPTTVAGALDELQAEIDAIDVTDDTPTVYGVRRLEHGMFVVAAHNNAAEALYTFASFDGVSWTQFGSSPAIAGPNRDPSLMHYDGKWWIATTHGGGLNATDYFDLYNSSDLLTWSSAATVSCSGVTPAATWAPQWFIDTDGSVHILVALKVSSHFKIHELHPTNQAMTTWSTPVQLSGSGFPTECIDPSMAHVAGTYYLFFKDDSTGYIDLASSTSLTSGYTVTQTGDWASWRSGLSNTIEAGRIVPMDDTRWRFYFTNNNGLSATNVYYSETTDATFASGWTARSAAISTLSGYNHPVPVRVTGTGDLTNDAGKIRTPRLGDGTADSTTFLRGDLEWATPAGASFATPSIALGSSAAAGAASTVIRSDSTIAAFDATVPVTQAFSDAAATGSAAFAARRDHKHGMPASPAVTGGVLLIADTHSTPIVFGDVILNEAGDDFLYSD